MYDQRDPTWTPVTEEHIATHPAVGDTDPEQGEAGADKSNQVSI